MSEYNLKDGTPVNVSLPNYKFKGVVVGKSSNDINEIHIIACTDGFLPNETYPYSVCVVPRCYIETSN